MPMKHVPDSNRSSATNTSQCCRNMVPAIWGYDLRSVHPLQRLRLNHRPWMMSYAVAVDECCVNNRYDQQYFIIEQQHNPLSNDPYNKLSLPPWPCPQWQPRQGRVLGGEWRRSRHHARQHNTAYFATVQT